MKASVPNLKVRMAKAAKSRSNRVHVISRTNGWVVKKEGNKKASTSVLRTKKEAVIKAQNMVENGKATKVIVHGKDGKVEG